MHRVLPLLCAAACTQAPPESRGAALAALPHVRHGHRIEHVPGGHLCFGGFALPGPDGDRGKRQTLLLADGAAGWRPGPPLRHGHAFFGSAVIDGNVYAIGEAVERFDAERGAWAVVVAPGALPRSHLAAAAVGGTIHVLGGFPAVGTGYSIVDVRTGAVTAAEPPPSFEHGDHLHFLAGLSGELHVIGGIDGETMRPSAAHWVRRAGNWHALPDCPRSVWAKFGFQACHEGKLFLFGEFGGLCYDPAAGTWHPRSAPPDWVTMPAAAVDGDAVWVVGGRLVERSGRPLWRYDVREDRWHDLSPPG